MRESHFVPGCVQLPGPKEDAGGDRVGERDEAGLACEIEDSQKLITTQFGEYRLGGAWSASKRRIGPAQEDFECRR